MSHLIHMESNYRGVRWYNRQRYVDRQMIRCSVYYRHLWGGIFPQNLQFPTKRLPNCVL